MITVPEYPENLSFWQLVFLQSKVNGAPYQGAQLPLYSWEWPKNTYLQRRLRYLRESQTLQGKALNLSPEARYELLYRELVEEYRSGELSQAA